MSKTNFCWDILDTYFQNGGSQDSVNPLVKHQIDSYNKFIDNTLGNIINGFNPIKIFNNLKNENNEQTYKIHINVLQPSLTKPSYHLPDCTQTIMTPHIARMNNLTYSSSLYVNIHIIIELINKDGVIEKFDKTVNGVYIGKIPVMVRSKACVLYQIPALGEEDNNECRYDYGGYFIVNGNEKVLISQDRINENKTLVFQPNNNIEGLYAEIRSMSDSTYLPPKTTSLSMSGKLNHMGRIIRMNTSFIRTEIPVFVMFRALGVLSDKEIIQHIVYDLDNIDNKRIIAELMACCEDACEVHTQEQAENVLMKIMTGSNKLLNNRPLLHNNIINDFLPHVGKNYRRKALYLGYMIRKMIRIYLKYDSYDNRDSYMNKRIDTPGVLMSNLFRQCYGKMTKDIKNTIERELNLWRANQTSVPLSDIITDINIHRYFKQSLIESWLKYSLSTGNWGIKSIGSFQNIKQGVSQVLNRMSYASTLSHLRRINTSMEKNGKLVQPRKLDNSQFGLICPAETPEGSSVGLVKNMAFSTNISISMNSKYIRELLFKHDVIEYNDDFSYETDNTKWINNNETNKEKYNNINYYLKHLGNYDNVFIQINGDIIGYHTNPLELYNIMKHYKRTGIIPPMTSIIWNIKNRCINISTEAGRMYRPLLIVDIDKKTGKRELRITKILREKNITWKEYFKNKTFDSFIAGCANINDNTDEEGFIEYLDSDEINFAMIAIDQNELDKNKKGSSYPPFYTHCEIHPSLINGILGVNIPFSDHNQSPRNCYQCISENEKVLMSNGTYKMIKNINIGDEVICFDIITKQTLYTTVINKLNQITTKIVFNINLINGKTITATNDHNFMTNFGWKNCIQFNNDTKLGININSNYKNINNIKENITNDDDIIILSSLTLNNLNNLYNNFYKDIELLPLNIDNFKLPVIARICGYYYYNKCNFQNIYDQNSFNKDVMYIGFKDYGYYDTRFVLYIEKLIENINWLNKCSNMIQTEFISSYLSICYGTNTINNISYDMIKHEELKPIINNILNINKINNIWNIDTNDIIKYYKKIGIRYNYTLLKEIANIAEYNIYKQYYNLVKNTNINIKDYSFEEWSNDIYIEGDLIFIPFCKIYKNNNNKVSDITVSNDNHCFFAGDGFAVSNCAMGKQALGIYMSNFNKRIDTMGNILNYPQKPLVFTKLSKYTHSNELPSGTNAIIAIMTHTGFNQEDSVMINQSALDRGLFTSTYYKAFKDQCSKNHSTGEEEKFTNPSDSVSLKPFSYEKLNDNGFVPKNTYIDGNDILIGKIMPKKTNGAIINQDNSMCMKANDDGYIDMNYTGINSEGYQFAKVRVRKNRKPEIGDKLACYSPDHEYLTTDGWIPVADLTLNHKVASMVDGKLIYQNPIKLHEFDYEGKMYQVKSNHVDLLVTPNHRMLYKGYHKTTKWNIKKAEELYHTRYRFKKNVDEWKPCYDNIPEKIKKHFIIEDGEIKKFKFEGYYDGYGKYHEDLIINIEDWIIIYAVYVSEGCVSDEFRIVISAHKVRIQEVLDKAINNTQIKMTKTYEKGKLVKWSICNRNIARYIGNGIKAINKHLLDWVWYLNKEQSKKLLFTLCLGDGCMRKNGTWTFNTSSTVLINDMQRLCLHSGYCSNLQLVSKKGTRMIGLENFKVNNTPCYSNADNWSISIIEVTSEPIINKNIVAEKHKDFAKNIYQDEYIDYIGKVYCCTLEKGDGIVYIRRNGTPIWCGQSRSAQKGTIGMIYRQEDMPFTKDGITPDIIMNPHAIPSRMTMAQLLECIMGKAACHIGSFGDATPFTDCSVESIAKVLELSGMERYGNEIMYNGRTGEQIKTEIFIGPTYYQRLKHMVCDKLHCLLKGHDVLTSECWKDISEITINDKVATLKDGKLVYEYPTEIHHYPNYKGKIYKIENNAIDLEVTANHRMYIKSSNLNNYHLEKAENIIGKIVKYKKNAIWDIPDYEFVIPSFENYQNKKVNMNTWIIFFAKWINTDDNIITNNIDINDEFLNINYKQLYNYLSNLNKHYLPDWVWSLSNSQAKLLVKYMQNYNNGGCIYFTKYEKMADDYMKLCLHAGWSGLKTKYNNDLWRVSVIQKNNQPSVNHTKNQIEKLYDYEGPVYCISVPSEIFMVRKNGKPVWTGNSRGSNGPIVMLTRQPSEGRARNGGLRLGEMERDCLIGHGISEFLKEKMLDTSDNYRIFICKNCGLTANSNPNKNIYKCNNCKTYSDIVQVRIPYAFKLLTQELYTMNIKMGFDCA